MSYKINRFKQSPKGFAAIVASVKQIIYSPVRSIIIILVMSLALFLALASYLLWGNVGAFYENWNESVEITVYFKKKVDAKRVDVLVKKLKENPIIANLKLIKPDDGMKVFMDTTSLTALLSSFAENPLPYVVVLYPKIKDISHDRMLSFIHALKGHAEVDVVKADMGWVERSYSWLNLLDKFFIFFVFMLGINALLIVCGTSYAASQIFVSRDRISKIVLQYQFALYGFISSLLALLFVKIFLIILQDSEIFLGGLDGGITASIVFISSLISLISSRMVATDG